MSTLPPEANVMTAATQTHATRTPFWRTDAPLLTGMKLVWLLLLTLGLLLPVAMMLLQATGLADRAHSSDQHGLALVTHVVQGPNFPDMVGRTLAVSSTVAAMVVPLAFAFAYAVQRTRMPLRGTMRTLAMLPLFAPSLLPGIALVYLFGNQGLFKAWMNGGSIYGFWGIVLGESFYTFPYALMLLLATLTLADGRLYDAARAMGAGQWRTFCTVTLPGARYGLFGAFTLVFTLVATDFGVPTVVGGSYQVLAVEAYKAVLGQQQFARGAVIGLMLLLPALLTFAVERLVQRRQHAALASRAQPYHPQPDRHARWSLSAADRAARRLDSADARDRCRRLAGQAVAVQPRTDAAQLRLRQHGWWGLAGVSQQPDAGRAHDRVRYGADLHRRVAG